MIEKNKSLKAYNTFGIDVLAALFVTITSTPELQNVLSRHPHEKKIILGSGSNILFTQNVDGLVIYNHIQGIEKIKENNNHVYLKIGAGENWHQLVLYCLEKNYAGIENLSLIPGTVGASPIQNIGAYGVELKSVLHEVHAIEIKNQQEKIFSLEECELGYRSSIFKNALKNKYIITHVVLRLNKKPIFHIEYGAIKEKLGDRKVSIQSISDAIIQIRQEKLPDPKKIPNAGSFFKNPVVDEEIFLSLQNHYPKMPYFLEQNGCYKIPAAWLIEQCGFKGKRLGDAGTHENQALVLVNYGNATGADILALANQIQKVVQEKMGIKLNTEVNIY